MPGAGPGFVFDVKTSPEISVLRFRVTGLIARFSDFTTLFEGFGELFKANEQEQFAGEGAFSGGWAPLSPVYAAWKASHGFPGVIGVLHGFLRSGMTGGAGYTQHVHKTSADYGLGGGPATKYGQYFDGGNTRGMPARTVIAFGPGARGEWRKLAEDWAFDNAVAGGWGA